MEYTASTLSNDRTTSSCPTIELLHRDGVLVQVTPPPLLPPLVAMRAQGVLFFIGLSIVCLTSAALTFPNPAALNPFTLNPRGILPIPRPAAAGAADSFTPSIPRLSPVTPVDNSPTVGGFGLIDEGSPPTRPNEPDPASPNSSKSPELPEIPRPDVPNSPSTPSVPAAKAPSASAVQGSFSPAAQVVSSGARPQPFFGLLR
jgi:hypothetical protein